MHTTTCTLNIHKHVVQIGSHPLTFEYGQLRELTLSPRPVMDGGQLQITYRRGCGEACFGVSNHFLEIHGAYDQSNEWTLLDTIPIISSKDSVSGDNDSILLNNGNWEIYRLHIDVSDAKPKSEGLRKDILSSKTSFKITQGGGDTLVDKECTFAVAFMRFIPDQPLRCKAHSDCQAYGDTYAVCEYISRKCQCSSIRYGGSYCIEDPVYRDRDWSYVRDTFDNSPGNRGASASVR